MSTTTKTLGKYKIIEEIGRGGYSVVYHAVDASLKDRPVALKVLHPQLSIDPTFIERFHREAGVAANLKHPNIATIYEVGEIEGDHFIAMELVEGESLDTIISKEGPLPLARVVNIVRQIASALDYAHREGILHRDVKSGNIIVGPEDRAVLTDFGLVKAGQGTALTSLGQILGTPEYMSPEQAEGKEIDGRSDLYSLGVVVYEMCTGQVPFKGPTPSSVHYQHVNKAPPPPSELNPDLAGPVEEVLLKALAKRPEDRFQTAQALADELAKAVEEVEEKQLASLYIEATELFEAGEFQQAAGKFEELLERRPEYRDAATRLEECRQREQIPVWYAEAKVLVDQAQERLQMIRQVDPDFEDPEGLLAARQPATDTEDLYAEFLEAVQKKQWPAAARFAEEIQRTQPDAAGARALAAVVHQALENDKEVMQLRRELQAATRRRKDTSERQNAGPMTMTAWGLVLVMLVLGFVGGFVASGLSAQPTSTGTKVLAELVQVPAGPFTMGSDSGDGDEQPAHTINLPEYWIGKYEVTNEEYAYFVRATGYSPPSYWQGDSPPAGKEKHPVVNVSWHDAVAYCDWLSEVTGKPYRLPTEAEWEKAARGTDGREYPWGNEWDAQRANTIEGGAGGTTPVGQYPQGASPYGALDMAGNVREWTNSLYWGYPYRADDGREDRDAFGRRIARGGAWYSGRGYSRTTARIGLSPDDKSDALGLRVVAAP